MDADFRWQDGERLIRFGRGAVAEAPELLGDGYVLLTTPRTRSAAPEVAERAAAVHEVPAGLVDEIAAALRPHVNGHSAGRAGAGAGGAAADRALLVALGGGRVIDTAKALAAADPPRRVAAIPTTLSAAEMTRIHRHAADVDPATPRVRPAIVINDPSLCASQPEPDLVASALNSLGHAIEAPATTLASPVPSLAAHRAADLIVGAFDGDEPDRDALALGALLSGYAIDASVYGLHHVMSQTLVRVAGVGHGAANAVMLPHTAAALRRRSANAVAEHAARDAARLVERFGTTRLRDLGVDRDALDACVSAAASRAELALTPPPAGEDELREIYAAAW